MSHPYGNKALTEAVQKEKGKQKKISIAALFITHADRDHITVRKRLREEFDIALLIDSGRDYDTGIDFMDNYLKFRNSCNPLSDIAPLSPPRSICGPLGVRR